MLPFASAWSTTNSSSNPTYEQRRRGRLDLVVAGSRDAIVMVEAGGLEVSEEQIVQALEAGHEAIRAMVEQIEALAREVGQSKLTVTTKAIAPELQQEVERQVLEPLTDAMRIKGKLENYAQVDQVLDDSPGHDAGRQRRSPR